MQATTTMLALLAALACSAARAQMPPQPPSKPAAPPLPVNDPASDTVKPLEPNVFNGYTHGTAGNNPVEDNYRRGSFGPRRRRVPYGEVDPNLVSVNPFHQFNNARNLPMDVFKPRGGAVLDLAHQKRLADYARQSQAFSLPYGGYSSFRNHVYRRATADPHFRQQLHASHEGGDHATNPMGVHPANGTRPEDHAGEVPHGAFNPRTTGHPAHAHAALHDAATAGVYYDHLAYGAGPAAWHFPAGYGQYPHPHFPDSPPGAATVLSLHPAYTGNMYSDGVSYYHPGVDAAVGAYAAGVSPYHPAFAPGSPYAHPAAAGGPVAPAQAMDYMRQAQAHAHAAGSYAPHAYAYQPHHYVWNHNTHLSWGHHPEVAAPYNRGANQHARQSGLDGASSHPGTGAGAGAGEGAAADPEIEKADEAAAKDVAEDENNGNNDQPRDEVEKDDQK